jgi:hypothetical protein
MSSELTPRGRVEVLPARNSTPVDHIINAGRRGFEYLGRNGDQQVGFMIQLIAVVFGIGLVWYNIDEIKHFVDTAVATGTALIKGGIIAAVLWVMWLILSNKRTRSDASKRGLLLRKRPRV